MRIIIDTYSSRCVINKVCAFTDRVVSLAWIHSTPSRWQTFVANRVTKIQVYIAPDNFYHISGKENPADFLSRGLTPSQLLSHPLWFPGPRFARSPPDEWSISQFYPSTITDLPESKTTILLISPLKRTLRYLSTHTRFTHLILA
ncbi:hypothetical protein EVAR_28305_1 [Eumeta japonica]|uniref:Uncharacterized protein n=1 Tax=Eumeta variegata TaxID=151549 RepID=A0A4C1V9Z8_EUMVA|nr:hypothetical protein EVAR_28305_1 [Eumeta japonica]